jgi:hypothetical protein
VKLGLPSLCVTPVLSIGLVARKSGSGVVPS